MQLIEGAAPPRPSDSSDEIMIAVADGLLPRVLEWLSARGEKTDARENEHTRGQLLEALDRAIDWDGYKLCRALSGWEADTELVEIMDDASTLGRSAHRKAVARWVADFDIRPAHSLGDIVRIDHRGAVVEGEIVRIEAEEASYTIHCPSLGHIRPGSRETGTIGFCVPFEGVDRSANSAPQR